MSVRTPQLTKEQQEVWDRLKYTGPKFTSDPLAKPIAGSIYFDHSSDDMWTYDGKDWKLLSGAK